MKKTLLFITVLIVLIILIQKFNLFPRVSKTPPARQKSPSPTKTKVAKLYIGIHYKMIDKQTAKLNGIFEGAYITQVIDDQAASKSGLLEEDIIIEFDGKKIDSSDSQVLTKLVSEKKPGEKVILKVWRNKKIIDVIVIPIIN